HLHVTGIGVGFGVDRNGAVAQFLGGTHHPAGDFPTVGDQDLVESGHLGAPAGHQRIRSGGPGPTPDPAHYCAHLGARFCTNAIVPSTPSAPVTAAANCSAAPSSSGPSSWVSVASSRALVWALACGAHWRICWITSARRPSRRSAASQ